MTQPIHNFVIIAHIDHGKSTLADRMLEKTHTVEQRKMKAQLLDQMELEREKGITIKLQPVKMQWRNATLNLIDTPGHVDFQYEVSRSLQAVEGAVLLVDATQGVQAQTTANLYLAIEQNLEIIPVINKVDLPAADVPKVKKEIISLIGGDGSEILEISAKTGQGVEAVLDAVIARISPAMQQDEEPLKALIFDSVYDDYKGVMAYVRIMAGQVEKRQSISFLGTSASDRVVECGFFNPTYVATTGLKAGDIGYIATGLKDVRQARVGDTITSSEQKNSATPLAGFTIPQPKVFAGIFPKQGDDFPRLREAMSELQLNDASLTTTEERNEVLGQGFRCGFLGMLHLEIIQERLRREYDLDLVVTTPSVAYRVKLTDGTVKEVATASEFPDPTFIDHVEERYATVEIMVPANYLGATFELMQEHEGTLLKQEHPDSDRVNLTYEMPLRELVVNLYDQIKSATSGYGSLSYELGRWQLAQVVKLTVLINHDPVEALATIVARHKAEAIGRQLVTRLKEVIPRQLFAVPIQTAIGGKVIARETLPAMRKDVTGHLYGGDVTRKRKLLEKQKRGKKKMASQSAIDIPTEAYLSLFKES